MVQSIDNNINRQNYNAVKINIQKPQMNGNPSVDAVQNDNNGNYSAVSINIDNPTVNMPEHRIYDYPEAQTPITYDMANINQIPLPQGFHVAYQTTNLILPKMENELEIEVDKKTPEKLDDKASAEEIEEPQNEEVVTKPEDEINASTVDTEKKVDKENKNVEVPEPNFTTVEAEKGEEKIDNTSNDVEVMETETKGIKKPEIIPGEEIKPDVDIPLVISNLTNEDFDVQAQQMEEIARVALDNSNNAIPYIVRDVFSSLIDITKKDSAELAAPTDEQIQARRKVIANFVSMENGKANNQPVKIPYSITEKDVALADTIAPMEQA